MSSKKDKLIEEAQKFALRGQMDKAIKAYRQVVALDPSAINQRQRLADLLIKSGSLEDARVEFESIGKYYSANGFYLKAIAVYKKLQVLLPGEISITLTLADLNEKHGLVANALSEYKQVYEYYKSTSNNLEALKILERMHNVDKQNIGITLMLAESYFQAARKDDSYTTFADLASLLHERGDNASCIKLNDRIKQLFPEKPDFMYEVLVRQVEEGKAANAVSAIQAMLQQNPNDKRFWELIVKTFRRLNEPQRVKAAYQHYLKFFPTELSAQKGLLECLVGEHDVAGTLALLAQYEQGSQFIRLLIR
jgi:tetratricopeptide (TPR) repeat protein